MDRSWLGGYIRDFLLVKDPVVDFSKRTENELTYRNLQNGNGHIEAEPSKYSKKKRVGRQAFHTYEFEI